MELKKCFKPNCQREIEYSCQCSSPETYLCQKHFSKHCLLNNNRSHSFNLLFLKPIESTKQAILNFLEEEMSKRHEIKLKIVIAFSQTLCKLENNFKNVLKELENDTTKISNFFEKILKTQKLKDEIDLNLLTLRESEAIEKVKIITSTRSSYHAELFCERSSEIDKIINSFSEVNSSINLSPKKYEIENKSDKNNKTISLNIKGSNELAYREFKENLKINPSDDTSYNGIGNILKNEGSFELAIKYYNDAIINNPNCALYYKNKGDSLNELGKWEWAIDNYKEAIRIDSGEDKAYNSIADIFYKKKNYDEAIKNYNEAIRINPNCAVYYKNKGNALKALNRREEAFECYNEAIRLDSNKDVAYNDIGNILKLEERYEGYEEAIKYYNEAIQENPSCAVYYTNKGNMLNKLGKNKEAIECYNQAIGIDKNEDNAYNGIGNILKLEKNYEEAIKYYDMAIKLNPNSALYLRNKAIAINAFGRIEEAKSNKNSPKV